MDIDPVYIASVIWLFAETRSKPQHQYNFRGMTELVRSNWQIGDGAADGVAIFLPSHTNGMVLLCQKNILVVLL